MPNPKILSDLLKAAGKLPKGSPAAKEAVAAKIAAEEAEQAARYAPHTPPTETGRKALAKAKQTLMTPEKQAALEAKLGQSWAGKKQPDLKKLAKHKDKFLYHSGTAKDVESLHYGIEPTSSGDWVKEIAAGAVDDVDELLKRSTPLSWFSDEPTWVKIKVARELGKKLEDVTREDIKNFGHLAIINKKDPYLEKIWRVGEQGLSEGPSSKVRSLFGEELPAWQTELFQEGSFGQRMEPFGVERNEWVATQPVEPFLQLTGEDLVKYLDLIEGKKKKNGGLAMATGGQVFPLQEEFQAEVERRAARPRTRAGVPVEDTNVLGGALRGLANTLGGLAFGRTVGTLGMPADILEPTATPGAMIPMFGMAGMPSEISKALVQQFAPKGPDIPAPTSEYLLEKGLEKFKPSQEFEQSAKLARFMPFDIAEMEAAGRKLKTLQPTFMEMMESGLQKATAPARMYAAPEDGAKLSKEEYSRMMREKYAAQNLAKEEKKATAADLKPQEVKVPADELGFYSPAEKAAANLKRNIGTGEAFLQDIKKAPDVSPDELEFTGLERWLKGKKTVSKQEIQDYMNKNRLVLEEVEYKQGTGDVDEMRFPREGDVIDDYDYIQSRADDIVYDWDDYGYKSRDEIREEILDRYTPEEAEPLINSGQIDEMVDEAVNDLAYQQASDEYYENPYRRWRNDAGYEIFGNDEVGYQIQDPRGRDITPSRGVYDFETAEGEARQHGMDYGFIDEGETKYHDYQLPGGSNYRELLIKTPESEKSALYGEIQRINRAMDNALDAREYAELQKERSRLMDEVEGLPESYESSHWDEPNVLAHVRLQDRVDSEGNKILYVDEMQSDWHQEGRRKGYKLPKDVAYRMNSEYEALVRKNGEAVSNGKTPNPKDVERAKYLENELIRSDNSDIPRGPFTDNWHKMALKRVMKYAADNGYTRVGFSKAQPQVNRWGTDVVAWRKTSVDMPGGAQPGWEVTATEQRGGRAGNINLEEDARARGILQETRAPIIRTRDELYAQVAKIGRGKSEAELQKLTDRIWKQMQEKDAGIVAPREAGMKKFYDEELEGTLKKYANTYKGKYGQTTLDVPGEGRQTINYIDITPDVKKSTSKGQPYKTGGAVKMADGGAVHPAVEKFAASLPHPAVQSFMAKMANGGAVWNTTTDGKFNTIPDVSDAEKVIQGPAV